MPRRTGLIGRLVDTGSRIAATAAEQVMSDPRGQEAVARAVGAAQRGMRRFGEVQSRVMKAAGIPGRQEYQELAKQLARIKRKARELSQSMERDAGLAEQLGADARAAAEDEGQPVAPAAPLEQAEAAGRSR